MSMPKSDRKIEKIIATFHLERPISRLPKPLRHAVARKRFGWIDRFEALRHRPDGTWSLIETERLNTIFIHIPKAAGLSVAESLFASHVASHTPLFSYLALYGGRRFDRMFKFTFVRHPLDRAVSAFRFLKSGGLTENDRIWAEQHLARYRDIEHFLCDGLPREEIRNWVHFQPQIYFLKDPRTGLIGVDYIGRFENINADFDEIAQRLKLDAALKHINRSARSKVAVSQAARRSVEDVYKEDFEALGY